MTWLDNHDAPHIVHHIPRPPGMAISDYIALSCPTCGVGFEFINRTPGQLHLMVAGERPAQTRNPHHRWCEPTDNPNTSSRPRWTRQGRLIDFEASEDIKPTLDELIERAACDIDAALHAGQEAVDRYKLLHPILKEFALQAQRL